MSDEKSNAWGRMMIIICQRCSLLYLPVCLLYISIHARIWRHRYLGLTVYVVRAFQNPRSLVNVVAVGVDLFVSLYRSSFSFFTYVLLLAPVRTEVIVLSWDWWCYGGFVRLWWVIASIVHIWFLRWMSLTFSQGLRWAYEQWKPFVRVKWIASLT